ncbi:MAG TPA: hypothetical protein VGC76_14510 [Pyrinomonadaceae bacterium]|jgi:hypothetical protein
MAPPLNQSNWIYGIGDTPMSNYTDDGSPPAELIKFVTTDQQSAKYTVNTANNEGQSTGTDWGTEQWIESHDAEIPFSIDPTMLMLTRLLLAAFGQKVTTSPTAGVTKNVFTPQDAASRQLPVYWMGEQCGDRHDALYPSCMLEKATFKGEESGKLNVAGNFRGSGQQLLGEDVDIVKETGKYYLKNTMSEIARALAATPNTVAKTYACGLQSFMFDVDNAADQKVGYDPGCKRFFTANDPDSGQIRSYHLFGKRKYGSKYVIWLEDSAPELALLRAQTELNLKMGMYGKTITGAYKNMFEIVMHLAFYKSVDLGSKNGFTTLEISPDAFYNEADNKIVSVTTQYATPA